MYLNPYIFIFFREGEVVLWDYKNHQQFVIDKKYYQRLLKFSENSFFEPNNPIDIHFLQEGIFLREKVDFSWGWDVVSQVFHVGTKDIPLGHSLDNYEKFLEEYIGFCENNIDNISKINTEKSGDLFQLPEPHLDDLDKVSFLSVLKNRMTSRFFYQEPIVLDDLSNLLFATFGQIHGSWKEFDSLGLQALSIRKSSPSAGGVHASEAYIVAMNVTGLPKGIYHYRSHQHVLSCISSTFETSQLGRLLAGQQFAEDLSFGIFITSRFDKLWDKYRHSRAYRVALLDIGHLSQTFQLSATAAGLECWLTGLFLDTEVNQLLHIDNTSEQAMFFIGAGKGRRQMLDEKTLNFLKKNERVS